MFNKVKLFMKQYFLERLLNSYSKRQLKNNENLNLFYFLNNKYDTYCKYFIDETISTSKNAIGYDWNTWSGQIRQSFKNGLPIDFLSHPKIRTTMVLGKSSGIYETKERLVLLEENLSKDILKILLKEDYIGKPIISHATYKTSANRAHHAMHLAMYQNITNHYFWETTSILEVGGGYGGMARVLRKINPLITYIIVDLPELLAVQYIYLASLESESEINIVNSSNTTIVKNKINLVSSEFFIRNEFHFEIDSFISTWAITECPQHIQEFFVKNNFLNAQRLLIASFIDENNFLNNGINFDQMQRERVPFFKGHHEYWVK